MTSATASANDVQSPPPSVSAATSTEKKQPHKPTWVKVVQQYQQPSLWISQWQLATSLIPYAALWLLMLWSLSVSYLLTLVLAIFAGGFLMRIFVLQHDCGHQSLFKNRRWNDLVGFCLGVLTMTPYEFWRSSHAKHHATSGDLDFRGYGDVWTMTVKEYVNNTPMGRLGYRLYRNPLIMFGFGPLYMFVINQRSFMSWKYADSKAEKRSLIYTDLGILLLYGAIALLVGLDKLLLILLPITFVAGASGVFLFYVQHQFEEAYWRYHPEWDFTAAALEGSSYLKLPKPLQWITGNIGLHHIHHLSPKIPNYLLEKAYNENPEFQDAPTLTLGTAIKIVFSQIALFDESDDRLISFREAHEKYLNNTVTA